MTDERLPLIELLQKAGDGDFLRSVAEAVLQLLMEADVEGVIGAARHERTAERQTYRNGFRDRTLDTRLGTLQLRIPKLRAGPSYFPPFLEPRKTSEKALVAVIQEAWIGGVSTRRVDELAQAMGLSGINKSQVSKLCKDIDERVNAFLDRLPGSPAQWRVALSLAGRHLPEAARGRADRFRGGHNRRSGRHRGPARDRRPAHRPFRGGNVLDHVPEEPGPARPARGQARHLRRPRGAQGRDPTRDGRHVAAVSRSLDEECVGLRAQGAANDGGRRAPAGVLATRPGQRPQGLAHHGRPVPGSLAQARQAARRERARCVGLSLLPGPAPGQVAQYELAGAAQQGSEAPRRCGRHLPVRVVHLTTDRRRAVGGQRRMAAAAPLHADRGHGRANVADRDRRRGYTRRAHPSYTPGRMTDGHLSPKPIPTILSDATFSHPS